MGSITKVLQKELYAIVRDEKAGRHRWLTPVPVPVHSKQPVGV